jgi:hypothetical protein
MLLNRAVGNEKFFGNFLDGQTLAREFNHLLLAAAELDSVVRGIFSLPFTLKLGIIPENLD